MTFADSPALLDLIMSIYPDANPNLKVLKLQPLGVWCIKKTGTKKVGPA